LGIDRRLTAHNIVRPILPAALIDGCGKASAAAALFMVVPIMAGVLVLATYANRAADRPLGRGLGGVARRHESRAYFISMWR